MYFVLLFFIKLNYDAKNIYNVFSNNKGLSSRHIAATNNGSDKISEKIVYILHAVGAKRCQNILLETECTDACGWNKNYNGIPPAKPISMPVCILSN